MLQMILFIICDNDKNKNRNGKASESSDVLCIYKNQT